MARVGLQNEARAAFTCGALVLTVISIAACSLAATPSPDATESADTPAASELAVSPSVTGTVIDLRTLGTATATDDPNADPSDSPTPPLPKGTLPNVKPAPAGDWTSIDWIALPGGNYPAVPTGIGAGDPNANLAGWSKGYVDFLWDPQRRTLTPWVSGNGLMWRAGTKLDLGAFEEDFKELDSEAAWTPDPGESPAYTPDPSDAYYCSFVVDQFEEGPSTMLLRGYLHCGDGCGSPTSISGDAIWVSSDGLVWKPVDVPATFGNAKPLLISGGSSGYVTLNGAGTAMLRSTDGRSWSAGGLPPGTNHSLPVALAGGFAMGDSVVMQKGHIVAPEGCLGGSDLAKYRGELWWSADGSNWTMEKAGFAGYGVTMDLARIDDHLVVADETTNDSAKEVQWVSSDGKSWTQLNGPPINFDDILAGRDHGLLVTSPADPDAPGVILQAFDSNSRLVTVKQTGDIPWDEATWVIGPTGILATVDGERFWIGVPSAR